MSTPKQPLGALPPDVALQLAENHSRNAIEQAADLLAGVESGIDAADREKVFRAAWGNLCRLQGSMRRLLTRLARQQAQPEALQATNPPPTCPETPASSRSASQRTERGRP